MRRSGKKCSWVIIGPLQLSSQNIANNIFVNIKFSSNEHFKSLMKDIRDYRYFPPVDSLYTRGYLLLKKVKSCEHESCLKVLIIDCLVDHILSYLSKWYTIP